MNSLLRFFALAAAAAPFLAQAAPVNPAVAGESVPGKWIITLKPDADVATVASHMVQVRDIHARNIARRDTAEEETKGIEREYAFGGFKGYAGSFDAATIEELKNLPEVLNVEEDSIMKTMDLVTQRAPSNWGLAHISSPANNGTDYLYDSSAGEGQFNYVIDTGVRITHRDFGGRAVWGFNAVNNVNTDNAGHGTHVAGTMVGSTYGVAKKATTVAVKVFEGDRGTVSAVIAGINWAVNDIVSKRRTNTAVINMSLGGPGSVAIDSAVTAAWSEGVLCVVAAGNEDMLASNRSPARVPEALTVANLQKDDARYAGRGASNYGSAVDIFAPGTDIPSAYFTSDTAVASLTGTSMASPHVAGLVSYLRALEGPMSAAAVKARVLQLAIPGRVTDARGSANLVAYNGARG